MIEAQDDLIADAPNPPQALRMGGVAFISHNVVISSIFGTTGVFLLPMQQHLHVAAEYASIAAPMVMIGSAVLSSVAGVLLGRFPLRIILLCVAALTTSAWLILALTSSFAVYLVAYVLLLGPAMALGGSVLPPTLVTRWFTRNRGLAIGLVHLPIMITIMPLAINWVIITYGLPAALFGLAALSAGLLIPAALLIIDHPPGSAGAQAMTRPRSARTPDGSLSILQLLGNRRFLLLAFTVSAINTSSVVLGVNLVSMGISWHFSSTGAAGLASAMSALGIAGSVIFGLLADRIGGARTLALMAFNQMVLWALLLLHAQLPYAALLAIAGLIGMHGAGAIPSMSKAFADNFGAATFSRAFGLAATVVLPLMIIGVIGTAYVGRKYGDYSLAILGMMAYLACCVPTALMASRRSGGPALVSQLA